MLFLSLLNLCNRFLQHFVEVWRNTAISKQNGTFTALHDFSRLVTFPLKPRLIVQAVVCVLIFSGSENCWSASDNQRHIGKTSLVISNGFWSLSTILRAAGKADYYEERLRQESLTLSPSIKVQHEHRPATQRNLTDVLWVNV